MSRLQFLTGFREQPPGSDEIGIRAAGDPTAT